MSFNKKTYPATIVLKKNMMVLVAGLLIVVMGVMIYNFTHPPVRGSASEKATKPVYTQPALKWYQQPTVPAPETKKPMALSPNPSPQTPPINQGESPTVSEPGAEPPRFSAPKTQLESGMDRELEPEALKEAMRAPITSNQLIGTAPVSNASASSAGQRYSQMKESNDDPNGQSQKKAFLEINRTSMGPDELGASLQPLRSPYEVQAGTEIPAELIKGINSDLPGQITAQVSSHVYDSPTGAYLLIPQGSRVVGLYDSSIAYGQKRVLVVWKRIIFPSGQSINLEGMPGADLSGYAGFHDKVDNHYLQLLGSVLLMSTLSAGAELSQPQNNSNNPWQAPSISQTLASSLGTNISDVGVALINKNLNVQPTLKIRPGYEFNISVTKDMVFPGPYEG